MSDPRRSFSTRIIVSYIILLPPPRSGKNDADSSSVRYRYLRHCASKMGVESGRNRHRSSAVDLALGQTFAVRRIFVTSWRHGDTFAFVYQRRSHYRPIGFGQSRIIFRRGFGRIRHHVDPAFECRFFSTQFRAGLTHIVWQA